MCDIVLILDAGAQYGKLIDRRVRSLRVNTEIRPLTDCSVPDHVSQMCDGRYKAVIISGGPESVGDCSFLSGIKQILASGLPVLGICYGFQLICEALNPGSVIPGSSREDGQRWIDVCEESLLFVDTPRRQRVLLTHADSVRDIRGSLRVTARSDKVVVAVEHKSVFGVQFHPETDLSEHGTEIFKNFLFRIAHCSPTFTIESRETECIREIRERMRETGYPGLFRIYSAGLDSSVCCKMLLCALGEDAVYGIHVDHGFMRERESDECCVHRLFTRADRLLVLDASEEFLNSSVEGARLCETCDPETKRRIIGDTFVRVVTNELRRLAERLFDGGGGGGEEWYAHLMLAQGTLRPDLIESASPSVSALASVIKTHHNDTALVRVLRDAGRVIEPLRDFHKNEVREIAADLGLDPSIVNRQPFPGPGLAIRIVCAVSVPDEFARVSDDLMRVDRFRAFRPTLLPVRSVGVQGDQRSYGFVVALRMTHSWQEVVEVGHDVIASVRNVNRAVVVLDSGQGEELEIVPTLLSKEVTELARRCDAITTPIAKHANQMPVVILPIRFGSKPGRCVTLRPFITQDFMTGQAAVPGVHIPTDELTQTTNALMQQNDVSAVFYDVTGKPPGTTEWE